MHRRACSLVLLALALAACKSKEAVKDCKEVVAGFDRISTVGLDAYSDPSVPSLIALARAHAGERISICVLANQQASEAERVLAERDALRRPAPPPSQPPPAQWGLPARQDGPVAAFQACKAKCESSFRACLAQNQCTWSPKSVDSKKDNYGMTRVNGEVRCPASNMEAGQRCFSESTQCEWICAH